jgi:hypothetical protein
MEHVVKDGNSHCSQCGLITAALTTDCPGERVSMERAFNVQQGMSDYIDGVGWVVGPKREEN